MMTHNGLLVRMVMSAVAAALISTLLRYAGEQETVEMWSVWVPTVVAYIAIILYVCALDLILKMRRNAELTELEVKLYALQTENHTLRESLRWADKNVPIAPMQSNQD